MATQLTAAEIGEKVNVGTEAYDAVALQLGASEEQDEQIIRLLVNVLHFTDANGWDAHGLLRQAQARFEAERS